jgi:hypothetical protein
MKVTIVAPIGTILGDARQEIPTAQLKDELVFKGGKRCHGLRSGVRGPLGPAHPLGVGPLDNPNKIRFVRV